MELLTKAIREKLPTKEASMSGKLKGLCCQAFSLPYSPTRLRHLAAANPDSADFQFVANAVIRLGYHRRNPKFPKCRNTPNMRAHFYSCKFHDDKTGKCTVYQSRPRMCRLYPNFRDCQYRAAGYDCNCAAVQERPYQRKSWSSNPSQKKISELSEMCLKELP